MKVVQRKSVKKVKVRVGITVPAWVINELGFEPDDERDWIPLEDDNGERLVALRRIPKKKEKEGEREKGGEKEETGEEKTS